MTIAHPPYEEGKTYRLTYTGSSWFGPYSGKTSEFVFRGDRFTGSGGWNQYPPAKGYEYEVEEIEEATMTEVLKYTADDQEFEFPVTASGNVEIDRATFEAFVRDYTALERQQEPIQYENGLYRDAEDDPVVVWNGELYIADGGDVKNYTTLYGPLTKVDEQ